MTFNILTIHFESNEVGKEKLEVVARKVSESRDNCWKSGKYRDLNRKGENRVLSCRLFVIPEVRIITIRI